MSVGPLGLAGSIAGGLPQVRGAETERSQQQAADQARRAQSDQQAEQAAGIGQTEEDAQVWDRDADGRRLWEAPQQRSRPREGAAEGAQPVSRDPTGESGGQLDLSG